VPYKNSEALSDVSKEDGLGVHAEKAGCMPMFRQEDTGQNHNIKTATSIKHTIWK
jgi:hypothetical protein